jgi:hypothetical protein
MKKGGDFDVPGGISVHLTRECGGNVHDRYVIAVTSGSFKKEIHGANPYPGAYNNDPNCAAENAADLEAASCLESACRNKKRCYSVHAEQLVVL